MNFLRKTALVLLIPIFCLLLFATAFDMGLLRVVDQPSNIKQILVNSGVYNTAVDSLLAQAKDINDNADGGGTISLTNPTVEAAANATITPQFLRSNTEVAIDSIYAWLDGKTAQPTFSVNLTNTKSQFSSTVAEAVETRAASLPVCTAANLPTSFDPLNASCLPPGVTAASIGSEVQGEIIGGKGFLDNPDISLGTVNAQGTSQSIFADQLKNAPKAYQKVKKTPIIFSVATLLVALAIIFLSASRRRGLRRVGVILILMGLLMLVFAWGINRGINQDALPKLKLSNSVLQQDARSLAADLTQRIDRNYWIFGAVYAALGLLLIGAALTWPRGQTKNAGDLEGEGKTKADRIDLKERDTITDLAVEEKPKPKPKPKPKTKPTPKKTTRKKIEVQ